MSDAVNTNVPTQQAPIISLTIEDLRFYRGFIDIAVARGAVQANEMEITGKFYKRLDDFLKSADAQKQNQPTEPAAPTAESVQE